MTQTKEREVIPKPRQRKLAKALILNQLLDKPQNNGEVAVSVGYPQSTAESHIKDVIEQKGTQIALKEEAVSLKQALIKQGINPAKIAKKIDKLLEATDDNGKDDYNAIDKGLKHANAIYGIDVIKPQSNTVYNFFYNPDVREKLQSYENQLKSLLISEENRTSETEGTQ